MSLGDAHAKLCFSSSIAQKAKTKAKSQTRLNRVPKKTKVPATLDRFNKYDFYDQFKQFLPVIVLEVTKQFQKPKLESNTSDTINTVIMDYTTVPEYSLSSSAPATVSVDTLRQRQFTQSLDSPSTSESIAAPGHQKNHEPTSNDEK